MNQNVRYHCQEYIIVSKQYYCHCCGPSLYDRMTFNNFSQYSITVEFIAGEPAHTAIMALDASIPLYYVQVIQSLWHHVIFLLPIQCYLIRFEMHFLATAIHGLVCSCLHCITMNCLYFPKIHIPISTLLKVIEQPQYSTQRLANYSTVLVGVATLIFWPLHHYKLMLAGPIWPASVKMILCCIWW